MRLIARTKQYRRDFTGVFQCEHCEREQTITSCYDDQHYHQNVIPKLECPGCGKTGNGPSSEPVIPAHIQL